MLARRSIGALGLIVTALGLAALAHTLRSAPDTDTESDTGVASSTGTASILGSASDADTGTGSDVAADARAGPGRAFPGLAALRDGARLDINRASRAELELLPGIGPRLAERILARRARRGPFAEVARLTEVSGIGERTLERLRPLITVAGERDDASGPSQRAQVAGAPPAAGAPGPLQSSKKSRTPPVTDR